MDGSDGRRLTSTPLRLRVLDVPRHACEGCSGCCSSYAIGPLLPDDLARLEAVLPAVREAFPDQHLDGPTLLKRRGDDEHRYLKKRDGLCVFYRRGLGCTIHATAGGQAKPLVCQLFPLQLVATEEGLRVGMRPTCLSDWKNWKEGPKVPGGYLQDMLEADPHPPEREKPRGEDALRQLLSRPDVDTDLLLGFLADEGRVDALALDRWLDARLRELFDEIDSVRRGDLPDDELGPIHPATVTAQVLADLRDHVESRGPGEEPWAEVPEQGLPFVRNALLRLVFLRQTNTFPTLPWAMVACVACARWAGGFASSGDTGFDASRFGRTFSTLLVLIESPRMQRVLLDAGPPFA